MTPQIYKLIHLLGLMMMFLGYGGLIVRAVAASDNKALRVLGAATSGIGLFLLLLGGFGMVARLNYEYTAGWLIVKYVLWIALGAWSALINRMPAMAKAWWWGGIVLGAAAAFLGLMKPF